jgi:N-acetylglucosamine kinase-like BadF-type ATPase
VVGDADSVLGTASAGPSNIIRVGEKRARESLHQAIEQACAAAGIEARQVHHACLGIAGVGRVEVAATVHKIVGEMIAGEIEVVGDMPIAMEAAFGEGAGVVVIAGTGSIAYGRDAKGRTARAGGWGFAISDEGSAHWIGRIVVRDLLRAMDQEQGEREESAAESNLLGEIKAAWKVESLEALVRTANSSQDFAALFPAILAAANGGDVVAENVLERAGKELAQLAGIVAKQLFSRSGVDEGLVAVALAGSVFRHSQQVREVFCSEIKKGNWSGRVSSQIIEPVMGALQMARKGENARS